MAMATDFSEMQAIKLVNEIVSISDFPVPSTVLKAKGIERSTLRNMVKEGILKPVTVRIRETRQIVNGYYVIGGVVPSVVTNAKSSVVELRTASEVDHADAGKVRA